MIRFQADADLHHGIVLAVRQREPAIDFASAAESRLAGRSDPVVLDLAASQGRILVTHDRRTMLNHFQARLREGKSSPGILLVSQSALMNSVVDAIVLIWSASQPEEWSNQAHHLPSMSRHIFVR